MRILNGRGFTLLEVLIAMTLLSMMMALLFASLKIGADSWQKGNARLARNSEIAIAQQFFRHYLVTAKPLSTNEPKKTATGTLSKALAFQGRTDSVQFVSALPASAARVGLQRFTVYRQQNQLKVVVTPFFASKSNKAEREELILLTDISDFSVAYFGSNALPNALQSSNSWQTEWLDKATLPRLIKINLTLSNGRFTPSIVIALQTTELLLTQP
jgi:general secretion pathway protein J